MGGEGGCSKKQLGCVALVKRGMDSAGPHFKSLIGCLDQSTRSSFRNYVSRMCSPP